MIDTYIAHITWYMQRNYQADILRERAQAAGISPALISLWLFISRWLTRQLSTRPAAADGVENMENNKQAETGALRMAARHVHNGHSPRASRHCLAQMWDLARQRAAETQRSGQLSRPLRSLHILLIICCQTARQDCQPWQESLASWTRDKQKTGHFHNPHDLETSLHFFCDKKNHSETFRLK